MTFKTIKQKSLNNLYEIMKNDRCNLVIDRNDCRKVLLTTSFDKKQISCKINNVFQGSVDFTIDALKCLLYDTTMKNIKIVYHD